MDPFAMAYYAVVCCALAGLVPQVPGTLRRIAVGAVVGALSAALLPLLRATVFG